MIGDLQTYEIIGAAMAVHSELGSGFLERVYHEALKLEFARRGIPFESEVALAVMYRGEKLDAGYRADFVCYGAVLVEIKAMVDLGANESAQVINYLKATGYERGLLFNFGTKSLQQKRFIKSLDRG
ncbi:GxxExxY protein [Sulfuriroseicoccus oceanibius]|uniref:GxxExxY protein n=1 Tax=Sulfuriroseicoccus oceanibius TaxID=2707525 RepID=A0A7T7JDN9_9BACT|nr:GxxExxY protein [Sulfuriroseicoccus oceanibius]QQL46284.1 GxxExxY protein [Sulfuriroseicoccus oceanibius]